MLALELGGQVAGCNVAGKLPGITHTAHDAPMEPGQHACNARQHQTQLGPPGQGTLPTQPARHHAHDDHAQRSISARFCVAEMPSTRCHRPRSPGYTTRPWCVNAGFGAAQHGRRATAHTTPQPAAPQRARLGAHRHIATRLAAVHDGRDVGTHPVKAAVFARRFFTSPVKAWPRPMVAHMSL